MEALCLIQISLKLPAKSKLVTDLIRTEDDVFRSLSKQDLLAMLG